MLEEWILGKMKDLQRNPAAISQLSQFPESGCEVGASRAGIAAVDLVEVGDLAELALDGRFGGLRFLQQLLEPADFRPTAHGHGHPQALAAGGDAIDYDTLMRVYGIVSTSDGKTLIVGHSNLSRLYSVDTATGDVALITEGLPIFPDGLAIQGRTVYSLHPLSFLGLPDEITVIELSDDLLSGEIVGTITDPDNLDGVASGAIFGSSLYVNNARYRPDPLPSDFPFWVTRISIRP